MDMREYHELIQGRVVRYVGLGGRSRVLHRRSTGLQNRVTNALITGHGTVSETERAAILADVGDILGLLSCICHELDSRLDIAAFENLRRMGVRDGSGQPHLFLARNTVA